MSEKNRNSYVQKNVREKQFHNGIKLIKFSLKYIRPEIY